MNLDDIKNKVVESYKSNTLNVNDAIAIVKLYLETEQPDKVSIIDNIQADLMNIMTQQLLSQYFTEARNYYDRYFSIVKVFDKNGNFIHAYAPVMEMVVMPDLKSVAKS